MNGSFAPLSSTEASSSSSSSSLTQPKPEPVEQEDPIKAAEKVKESGNVAFKAGRYGSAIDLYTKAIREHTITIINPYLTYSHRTYRAQPSGTFIPNKPRSSLHGSQTLPSCTRRLSTRSNTSIRISLPKNPPPPRPVSNRTRIIISRLINSQRHPLHRPLQFPSHPTPRKNQSPRRTCQKLREREREEGVGSCEVGIGQVFAGD